MLLSLHLSDNENAGVQKALYTIGKTAFFTASETATRSARNALVPAHASQVTDGIVDTSVSLFALQKGSKLFLGCVVELKLVHGRVTENRVLGNYNIRLFFPVSTLVNGQLVALRTGLFRCRRRRPSQSHELPGHNLASSLVVRMEKASGQPIPYTWSSRQDSIAIMNRQVCLMLTLISHSRPKWPRHPSHLAGQTITFLS